MKITGKKDMDTWAATALNTAPDSENRIHGDELAKEYGFEGGLVPGVTISAYLVHPLVELWGKNWLDSGYANCRITSPLYDGEAFDVETDIVAPSRANTTLVRRNGVISAHAEVTLTDQLPTPPILRKDKLTDLDYKAPNSPSTPGIVLHTLCRDSPTHRCKTPNTGIAPCAGVAPP